MATGRVLPSAARQRTCQSASRNVFVALSSPRSWPGSNIGVKSQYRLPGKTLNQLRCFSALLQPRSELVTWKAATGEVELSTKPSENEPDLGQKSEPQPLPWYLQVRKPQQEPKSALERQRLPDLPPEPPPLLQPMLQHISVDLGLDDLSLLDLRDLDPPPALGANLVMIIGTARSEKHLHVSADRFCRWLRTAHQLTPYADGLLGRGELRLKLKRKNRRARMLNSVGASDSGNTDDGTRTGWVCVNIGAIEDGRAVQQQAVDREDDDYVGFGGEISGVKVVVQMLTEEKREELDLETLWSQALGRYTRRRDRIAKGQEEEAPNPGPSFVLNDSSSSLAMAP
ncbi:MAG: hypothetical protein L6R40_004208 [Gallowayella cf. fulva]|nr:MAG: hypothetical protein L6R40_004208 [Xanthomendoza cf. fulva]